MNDPTNTTGPEDRPDDATWAEDVKTLLARYGDEWSITRGADDMTLICERKRGTELRIIGGPPRTCIERIAALDEAPKSAPDEATILRGDAGAWITGMQL